LIPSGEYIKTYWELANLKISTTGIAVVSMLHGYSRQCSTVGFLSNSWASCHSPHVSAKV